MGGGLWYARGPGPCGVKEGGGRGSLRRGRVNCGEFSETACEETGLDSPDRMGAVALSAFSEAGLTRVCVVSRNGSAALN